MIAAVHPGSEDLARHAADLAARLPEPLRVLAPVAYNYRWSWLPDGPRLFRAVDPTRWEACGRNPVRLLQEVSGEALARASADAELLRRAAALDEAIRADLERPPATAPVTPERPAAFFCAEYAVHPSLPIYSGGLGALAGDMLKEASDHALPMVGVGLMYRQGFFRQRLDGSGWQHEYWVDTDPDRLPAALVTGSGGEPVTVTLPVHDQEVTAQIWRVDVGRVPLFLLDAYRHENGRAARWITSQLYVDDRPTRLAQYLLLGIGGVRALAALGIEPALLHLNEGHAAFAALELARAEVERGASLEAALAAARERTVFTTHTPVPAGNDTYPAAEITRMLDGLSAALGLDPDALVRMGRTHPDDAGEPFGVTQFALHRSRTANGVSRRHGGVAREMWRALWPRRKVEDVPITHVTNGVHLPTWLGRPMRQLLDSRLGEGWLERAADPSTWSALDDTPDADLWAVRQQQRAELVEFVRDRSVANRLAQGEAGPGVEAAARAFDPDALTIGFARRLATYKRLQLLGQDPGAALNLLSGERPVQVLLAGKAHPADDDAKRLVQALFRFKSARLVAERVVFLHDYDLGVAERLVQGCDLWVNVPRPPLEASGTSGMKAVVNGGLQLSVLDGWWAEAYDGGNGWALSGEVDYDEGAQDGRDGAELFRVVQEEVLPSFYDRDADGLPGAWIARMRRSLRTLGPAFCARRMLDDYVERVYAQPRPGRARRRRATAR
jgi:glycogen phosphorylase